MRVILQKIFGAGIDNDVPVSIPDFLIGRSPQCHLRPFCTSVSRVHCELIIRDNYVAIRDLGSRNGTFVNNDRVVGERQLFSGDNIGLGMCFFEIAIDASEEVPATTQPVEQVEFPAEAVMVP